MLCSQELSNLIKIQGVVPYFWPHATYLGILMLAGRRGIALMLLTVRRGILLFAFSVVDGDVDIRCVFRVAVDVLRLRHTVDVTFFPFSNLHKPIHARRISFFTL